jgi:hypothetical protein
MTASETDLFITLGQKFQLMVRMKMVIIKVVIKSQMVFGTAIQPHITSLKNLGTRKSELETPHCQSKQEIYGQRVGMKIPY